jgi:S-adenosylmethionine:tRNA ribosyltransferase-isomerase
MKTTDFNYHLPPERIAQEPLAQRDESKLLILHRTSGTIEHRQFKDIVAYLNPGDILVANDSRVIPARLFGEKAGTGGKVELLLLQSVSVDDGQTWQVLAGGRKLTTGVEVLVHDVHGRVTDITATIIEELAGAERLVRFSENTAVWLHEYGHLPLPPYIHTPTLPDPERYQTIYSRPTGSSAAPTAGLHFTPDLLFTLRDKGILFETVTLHVGLDTFQPVTADNIADHTIHTEWATLTPQAAQRINQAKLAGGRLIAIGTTSMRTLETAALRSADIQGTLQNITARDLSGETSNYCPWKPVAAFQSPTDLYIYPGYKFRAVDALITNFHIPQSTLLMLVSAFATPNQIQTAYQTALDEQYRFLSFGDAMLIL